MLLKAPDPILERIMLILLSNRRFILSLSLSLYIYIYIYIYLMYVCIYKSESLDREYRRDIGHKSEIPGQNGRLIKITSRKMPPIVGVSALSEQAALLRQEGNIYFQRDRFGAAIDAYTGAITLCPDVAILWTNRALCHRKLNDWTELEEDSRRAIQRDNSSIKGHYLLALALLQRKEYAEGVKELEKALDLGRASNSQRYLVEEIWQKLKKAKYLEWEHESTKRSLELQSLKEVCALALNDMSQATNSNSEQLEGLERVFEKAAEADMPKEVPDYLRCKILLDIFYDPVITPSGVTYERAAILEHFQKVGMFDPITREPLNQNHLIPNLAIKEAVQAFLDKHGWAYKTD